MDYRRIVDSFKAKQLTEEEIEERLSQLMLFLDLSSSLALASDVSEIAGQLLLSLMGSTRSRRSLLLLNSLNGWEVVDAKGFRSRPVLKKWESKLEPPESGFYLDNDTEAGIWHDLSSLFGVQLLLPILQKDSMLGLVGLGKKTGTQNYSDQEIQIAIALIQMCAGPLENAQSRQTLQTLNRKLMLKIYQLNTLFELSKDFHSVWDSETIFRILGTSLIGQLLISRCAVLVWTRGNLELKFVRGIRMSDSDLHLLQTFPFESLLGENYQPVLCESIPFPGLQNLCLASKIHLILPMVLNDRIRGVILLGERKNRKPFGKEEYDFISTLGNLALVADENARMHQEMIEKHRMERELAIAREIQEGLLPHEIPRIPGYELSSLFHPCNTVGGDYFDFFKLTENHIALAIGDVSGKSTPAALLMAYLHSSFRALTSMEVCDPETTIRRINKLLCESQNQSNKYITFFYTIVDSVRDTMRFVNAGHCYPLVIKKDGSVSRLETGGTVLGFFPDANYKMGDYKLDPGDLLILYTDGVSEMLNCDDEEFGVDRMIHTLRTFHSNPVDEIKEELVRALEEHRAGAASNDDITFVLLKKL